MKSLTLLLLLGCVGLAGCATPSIESDPLPASKPDTAPKVRPGDVLEFRFLHRPISQDEPYRIGIGDILRVDVFNHESLTDESILVLGDGHISLPLIPRLQVAGRTLKAVAALLAERYRMEQLLDPDVIVSVVTSSGRLRSFLDSVYRAGGQDGVRIEVEHDGSIPLPALEPVQAFRTFGEIRRGVQEAYAEEFGPELAVVMRRLPPPRPTHAYVIGEVTNPGPVEIDESMNAMIAVARAGGFLRSADMQKVRMYRFTSDEGIAQWQIDLAQSLEHGRHAGATIAVLPRDVIFVPKTGIALVNDAVDQYIRKLLPPIGFGFAYDVNPSDND